MEKVIGRLRYDILVHCPKCKWRLNLNEHPYDKDSESELGVTIFGSKETPGKWEDIDIEYECCRCGQKFILSKLEY